MHITITPDMINAGAAMVREFRQSDAIFLAEKIFKAMMEQIEGVRVSE